MMSRTKYDELFGDLKEKIEKSKKNLADNFFKGLEDYRSKEAVHLGHLPNGCRIYFHNIDREEFEKDASFVAHIPDNVVPVSNFVWLEESGKIPKESFENLKSKATMKNKEIIGYKLKDEKYRSAAKAYLETTSFENWWGKYAEINESELGRLFDHSFAGSSICEKFRELGVLDLWFTPVYKEEPEIKEGDWVWIKSDSYLGNERALVVYTKEQRTYGFNFGGDWSEKFCIGNCIERGQKPTPATDKEVEEALIAEAKRRYKVGSVIRTIGMSSSKWRLDQMNDIRFEKGQITHYGPATDMSDKRQMQCGFSVLFDNGQWAEVVETPKEEKLSPYYVDMRVLHELSDKELFSILHSISDEVIKRK